jgi:hypothetical protein
MHEPHIYPHVLHRHHLRGGFSITIGKIAAELKAYKAHPCYWSGTEVIDGKVTKRELIRRVADSSPPLTRAEAQTVPFGESLSQR